MAVPYSVVAQQFVPPNGFAWKSETAIAIARAVLAAVYGADTIRDEEPLIAKDLGDRWLVEGTLNCGGPPGSVCAGGVGEVEIAKSDGRVLRMTHGR